MADLVQPGSVRLPRRTFIAGTAALTALRRTEARAAVISSVVIGSQNWLYSAVDDMHTATPATWASMTGFVNGLVGRFRQHGIAVVLSLTPTKARVYPEYLPADFQPIADVQRRYATGLQMFGAAGTVVPDMNGLFAQLRAAPPPPPPAAEEADFTPVGGDLFFKADTHWTPNAAGPAAKLLATHLLAMNALPPSARPGAALGAPTEQVQEKNDLAEILPEAMQSAYPVQSYFLPEVAAAQGDSALIAVDAADVVVIGNSYMQPKYGFSDMVSSKLGRPVSLDWKIDRWGPYATMVDYLQSDSFRQQRPKAIIWNFREMHMEFMPDNAPAWGPSAMSLASVTAAIDKAAGG